MLLPLDQWNRLAYCEAGEYSICQMPAAGTREYSITPWTLPTGRRGYMLLVVDLGNKTQHEITPRGQGIAPNLHPSHLYRTQQKAYRAATKHDANQ